MADEDTERRLIALETRIAHHERMAEELSEVLARQERTIERLTLQIRHLHDKLRQTSEGWAPSPQDEKPPPHY